MTITAFLKIGDIAGESQRTGHEDEIDVHGISWGAEQDTAFARGRGRRRARSRVDHLVVRKFYDAASPYLMLSCMQGRSFDEITMSVRKDSGEAHLDYLVITMENVVIVDVEMNDEDAPNPDQIEERVALSFEKVNVKYTVQADDHSAGDEHEIEYDIVAGV